MDRIDAVIYHLQILWTWCKVNPGYSQGLNAKDCRKASEWISETLELLEEIKKQRQAAEEV